MKICAISDTHGYEPDLSNYSADVLVHAGDFTRSRKCVYADTVRFLEWLSSQTNFKHKIFIAGNHDFLPESSTSEFRDLLARYPPLTYLQDSAVTIDGIKFYGTPWTRTFFNWAFMKDEEDLLPIFTNIPKDTDVLITHTPPYGKKDLIRGKHTGSESLAHIEAARVLKSHIFGHFHEAYGNTEHYYNVSIVDDAYNVGNKPTMITIEDNSKHPT